MGEDYSDFFGPDVSTYSGFLSLVGAVGALSSETALLFGASGFVGRYTGALLSALGVRVVGATSATPEDVAPHSGINSWVRADLGDSKSLNAALDDVKPDLVINSARHGFARGAEESFEPMWSVNALGVGYLLEALREYPQARIVQVGSSTEYQPSSKPLAENSPKEPVGDFGRSKVAASALVTSWARGFGRKAAIVRPFKIYGPGEHRHRFLPTLFDAVLTGTQVPLAEGTRRDYVHVWDVAGSIVRAALVASDEVPEFSVGTGVSHSPADVVELVESITGKQVAIAPGAMPSDPIDVAEWRADTTAMRQQLGWMPEVSLEEGLHAWWQQIS